MRAILELDRAVARGPEDAVVAVETRLFGELWEGEEFRRVLDEWRRRSRRA